MFVTDRLVYLQLRKTGCGHIAHLLSECIGGEQVGVHNRITEDVQSRFVLGSVRNPWDWYVSVWAFAYGEVKTGVLYNRVTAPPRTLRWLGSRLVRRLTKGYPGLRETARELTASYQRPYRLWRSTYTHPDDAEAFRRWLKLVLDPKRSKDLGEGYGHSSVHRIAGFFTYRYLWLFARDVAAVLDARRFNSLAELKAFDAENNLLDYTVKTERLEDHLIRALGQAGYSLTSEQKSRIYQGKRSKRNKSERRSADYYYDAETAALVRQREQFIIDKYGYHYPGVPEGHTVSGSVTM